MKHVVLLILSLTLSQTGLLAQFNWTSQQSSTSADLNDVYFINADTGWIVGNNGTLLKTTDGGSNWSSLSSGTTLNLFSVFFLDANRGWIGGAPIGADDPNIHWTTDGGSTWQLATAPVQPAGGSFSNITDIAFQSDTLGWFVTVTGEIWVSRDGGDNWEKEAISSSGDVSRLNELGISTNRALAVGARSGSATNARYSILERGSVNTNFTWLQGPPFAAIDNEETMFSAFMLNDSVIFAGGAFQGKVYKQESLENADWSLNFEVPAEENASNIRAISFGNDQIGWFLTGRGDLTEAIVYQTLDQGDTWTELPRLTQNGITQVLKLFGVVDEATENHVWVVGRLGRIEKGEGTISSVKAMETLSTARVFPNPIKDQLNVTLVLDQNTDLTIKIYNNVGQQVKALYTGELPSGEHSLQFNGMSNLTSGMYFLRIQPTDGGGKTLPLAR